MARNINIGHSLRVTCMVVYYINKGETPATVAGNVLIVEGQLEDGALILKKGVERNGVLALNE